MLRDNPDQQLHNHQAPGPPPPRRLQIHLWPKNNHPSDKSQKDHQYRQLRDAAGRRPTLPIQHPLQNLDTNPPNPHRSLPPRLPLQLRSCILPRKPLHRLRPIPPHLHPIHSILLHRPQNRLSNPSSPAPNPKRKFLIQCCSVPKWHFIFLRNWW